MRTTVIVPVNELGGKVSEKVILFKFWNSHSKIAPLEPRKLAVCGTSRRASATSHHSVSIMARLPFGFVPTTKRLQRANFTCCFHCVTKSSTRPDSFPTRVYFLSSATRNVVKPSPVFLHIVATRGTRCVVPVFLQQEEHQLDHHSKV